MVARTCDDIGVRHATLTAAWDHPPRANIPAAARKARYHLLSHWAQERLLPFVATAHHAEDQAETVLMRLARGSGVGGLSGISPSRTLTPAVKLIRPLLGWRRAELRGIVDAAGIVPVDDPTNRDPRFDRTQARSLLAETNWLDPERLAGAASHCLDADEALQWSAEREFAVRSTTKGDSIVIDPTDLPIELKRRLLLMAFERLGADEPRGPDVVSAIGRLIRGEVRTLGGLKLEGGSSWRLSVAAPRRR